MHPLSIAEFRPSPVFTLVEIAIVLVIIGLLLGGILRPGNDHPGKIKKWSTFQPESPWL